MSIDTSAWRSVDKLIVCPLDVLTTPPIGTIHHFANIYWVAHPEEGALLYRPRPHKPFVLPQANTNRAIVEQLFAEMYPGAEIVHVEHAFLRVDYDGGYLAPEGAHRL